MNTNRSKKNLSRQVYGFARVLHVYTSTTLFGLMLFFCLTGIFLNHRWYDSDENHLASSQTPLSNDQLAAWGLHINEHWRPDLNSITDFLSQEYALPLPHSIDSDDELGELVLEFKVPAGFATVIIAAHSYEMTIEKESGSVVGILNDLHKGRHSGKAWSWLIDISGALMVFFSLTGLLILYQGRRFKFWGNCALLSGFMTPLFIYWVFVPSV